MNIIRYGDPMRLLETKYFECTKCGAIWSANKGEYNSESEFDYGYYYYCKCPTKECKGIGHEVSLAKVQPLIDAKNEEMAAHNDNYWENR